MWSVLEVETIVINRIVDDLDRIFFLSTSASFGCIVSCDGNLVHTNDAQTSVHVAWLITFLAIASMAGIKRRKERGSSKSFLPK